MLVATNVIMEHAYKNHYGVISPSIDGPDCLWAAIKCAERKRSPLILGMRMEIFENGKELRTFVNLARELAERATVPVSINFDHCKDMKTAIEGFYAGVTSVMLDYSLKSFEENVAGTKFVCDMCHPVGVSVEAELGHLGVDILLPGAENNETLQVSDSIYTDANVAQEFVKQTGVDCLAVSIGNKHGLYKDDTIPHIEFELLDEINKACGIPLVLHGGSGTGDDNLHKACQMGICKINVGADIRKAAADAVLEAEPKAKRTRGFFLTRSGYSEKTEYYMDVFGCTDKSWI